MSKKQKQNNQATNAQALALAENASVENACVLSSKELSELGDYVADLFEMIENLQHTAELFNSFVHSAITNEQEKNGFKYDKFSIIEHNLIKFIYNTITTTKQVAEGLSDVYILLAHNNELEEIQSEALFHYIKGDKSKRVAVI